MTDDQRRAVTLGGFALVLGVAIIGVLRWRLWSSNVPDLENGDLTGIVDPVALAADERYQAGLRLMAVIDVPLTLLVLAILGATAAVWTGWLIGGSRWRRVLAAPLAGAAIALVAWVAGLPIDAARFSWVRSHDVGRQPTVDWIVDQVEGLVITAVIFAIAAGLLALGIRYLSRVWWLALGGIIMLVTVFTVIASPVLFAPRFENTTPVTDVAVLDDVERLSERAGVPLLRRRLCPAADGDSRHRVPASLGADRTR